MIAAFLTRSVELIGKNLQYLQHLNLKMFHEANLLFKKKKKQNE